MEILQTALSVLLIVALATLCVLAYLVWKQQKEQRMAGPVPGGPPGKPGEKNPVFDSGEEPMAPPQTVAVVERGKFVLHGLMLGLSENVHTLLGDIDGYGATLDAHKAAIKKANTIATLQQMERVLLNEVESMSSATELYRRQLDEANAKIQKQEEELQKLSVDASTDFLTKMANRRSFDQRIGEEFSRFMRYGHIFSMIVLDIDHFKRINDTYGHVAGDRILRAVAGVLQEEQRETDFFARYGGEEFAMILPGTDLSQAVVVAEKLRLRILASHFNYEGTPIPVTLSGGVTQVQPSDDEPSKTIKRADGALYNAKEKGRNRIDAGAFTA